MDRPVTPSSHYGSQAPHSEVGSPPSTRPGQVNSSSRPVSYVNNGNLVGDGNLDIDQAGGPRPTSALSGHNDESHITAAEPPSSLVRSDSRLSQQQTALPSRGGTLKKKSSMKRTGSLGRTASRKSSYAGSVRSMKLGEKEKYEETPESNSAFYCPVPTQGNPTELLATRFQGMFCAMTVSHLLIHEQHGAKCSKTSSPTSEIYTNPTICAERPLCLRPMSSTTSQYPRTS